MSFFRYPGGKQKLLTLILKELYDIIPLFGTEIYEYREPFFGGGNIGINFLFSTNRVGDVWINDRDPGIFCLWNSVVNEPEYLKSLVNCFTPSVEAFYEFKNDLLNENYDDASLVEHGFKKLAIHQISYSGLGTMSGSPLGGKSQKSIYDISCRWSPEHICKKIDKLHSMFKLFNFKCTNSDFSDLITYDASEKVILYLDPPYFMKGAELYQYSFNIEDHLRLASLLKETKCKWILSYDDCEEIRNLYSWAKVRVIEDVNYSIAQSKDKETGEKNYNKKNELLISC